MSISFWQQAHRQKTLSYDVIVVGGGIVGCSTAYWLNRRDPSLRVALVEAQTLASGASGRNAGFILQGVASDYLSDVERYGEREARRLWHFTRANRDLIASELPGHVFGWSSDGSLIVAGSEDEDERLRESLSYLRSAGAPVVYLEPDQTNSRIDSTGLYGGLLFTSGGVVDPVRLVRHLAEASDAVLHSHLPVDQVHWEEGNGVLLDTPDLRLWGERTVLAVGPTLPDLLPEAAEYCRPVRAQMLATAPAEARSIPVPVYSHEGHYYIRQLESSHVLVGGGRHKHEEAEETSANTTTPAVQAAIERYLHTHFRWTQALRIQDRWAGTMSFSPDGRPVVGPVPEHPESVYATGFTGHGMGYGFRMGRLLAQRVTGTTRPDGYELFSVSRLNDNGTTGQTDASTRFSS